MREITAAEFETEVIDGSTSANVLCLFTAQWCSPCAKLKPVLEKFAEEMKDTLKVVKIDVDDASDLCKEYAIKSIPNLILFRDGVEARQHTGSANRETLLKLVG